MFLAAALSIAGVILWILWNAYEFGDPFRFAHGISDQDPFPVNNPRAIVRRRSLSHS